MDEIIGFARLPIEVPDFTDVQSFLDDDWQPHFNTRDYEGDWKVLPLRSPGGKNNIIPELIGGEDGFEDTVYMQKMPSVKQLINALQCPVKSARLLNLKAGAIIKQHRDRELAFEKGEARLHFPVQTNSMVEFYVNDIRVTMQTGESWYINANMPHRVNNYGSIDRIHLVIDCDVNDWLKSVFERSEKTTFKEEIDKVQTLQMIKALRQMQTETSLRMASELEAKLLIATDGE
ncbi:aspartyl/asparaginyl beta-hydroxylase domain-containing protein [Mucilaginibacter sp. AW1-3]